MIVKYRDKVTPTVLLVLKGGIAIGDISSDTKKV